MIVSFKYEQADEVTKPDSLSTIGLLGYALVEDWSEQSHSLQGQ
jgi:hypothetical protein